MWPSCRNGQGLYSRNCTGFVQVLYRVFIGFVQGLCSRVCAGFIQQGLYRFCAGFLQGLCRVCAAPAPGPCPGSSTSAVLSLHSGSHCTCSGGSNFPVIRGLGKLLRVLLALLRNVSVSECSLGTNTARSLLPLPLRKALISLTFCSPGCSSCLPPVPTCSGCTGDTQQSCLVLLLLSINHGMS